MSKRTFVAALLIAVTTIVWPRPGHAQTPAPARGRLLVTVNDPSGAVVPTARVTITGQDDATRGVAAPAMLTGVNDGVAVFENLPPGRYTIQAEFSGFETVQVRDFRVRAGDNKRLIELPIKKLAEDVTVGRDGRSAALDPKGSAFSTVLTREQIENLPDDPDEMEAVLKAMSPPGANIRVDGFTGGRLPPKSQIRSIRLPRMDQYAAQNHGGMQGLMFIDIMTQPGNGPLRGSVDMNFRDDALNAKNPFTPVKGNENMKQGSMSLSGTVKPNKSSFSFTAQHASLFDSNNINAALPDDRNRAVAFGQPSDRWNFNGRFDQATTKDRMLRASFSRLSLDRDNLGVGAYDLFERAYASQMADNTLRISENGPLGRKMFWESRLQLRWGGTDERSKIESVTNRVLDAFTEGGGQRAGGRHALDVELASDLDYVRGSHSYRFGMLFEGGRYHTDEFANYLGTYTFASLADYDAGKASNFTRRIGDPNVRYGNAQVGLYAQDDYRISRGVLISYGLRYEAQTLIADQTNFSPRATLTWAPFKSGRTTVRGGFGYFQDWLGTSVYEQTLKIDGFRMQEINIIDPSFPDPGDGAAAQATNRYLLDDGLRLASSWSVNAGIDQTLTPALRVSATYTHREGFGVLRGTNLNAPIGGVRPNPQFTNVISVVGDAEATSDQFGVNASYIVLGNSRQTFFSANYTIGSSRANSTGAFSLPASGDDLSTEWGQMIPRHRVGGSFSTQPIRNLSATLNFRGQSGTPYNLTTGRDDNGDGLFTDRPEGAERNSLRTTAQWDLGMRLSYAINFGPAGGGGSGGGQTVVLGGGGGGGGPIGGAGSKRYRVDIFMSVTNLTNHYNYVGYSGVMTSPYFGVATNVLNPRKIEIGTRFGF